MYYMMYYNLILPRYPARGYYAARKFLTQYYLERKLENLVLKVLRSHQLNRWLSGPCLIRDKCGKI